MTKKDYELIANVFKNYVAPWMTKDDEQIAYNIALRLANKFQENNPRFNNDKFLKACGFSD